MFCVVWDYSNSKPKSKQYKQKMSPKSYKIEIKILANLGSAQSCLEQPGRGIPCGPFIVTHFILTFCFRIPKEAEGFWSSRDFLTYYLPLVFPFFLSRYVWMSLLSVKRIFQTNVFFVGGREGVVSIGWFIIAAVFRRPTRHLQPSLQHVESHVQPFLSTWL